MDVKELLVSFATVLYLVFVCIGVGDYLLRHFKETFGLSISISYFLGSIIISNAFILLSILLTNPYNYIVLALFLVLFFKSGALLVVKKIRNLDFDTVEGLKLSSMFLFFLLSILLLILILSSLTHPTGWDEIIYHIPVVKEISGGSVHFPLLSDSPFTDFYRPFSKLYGNFPYAVESFASFAYSISGNLEHVVALILFVNYLFFCKYLYFFLRDRLDVNLPSIIAVIILLTLTKAFTQLLSTVYIDVDVAIYEFISLTLLFFPREKSKKSFIYLSALFLGFALGSKYTALYFLPVYVFFFVITSLKNGVGDVLKSGIQATLFAAAAGGFWYIKNSLLFYNPIFPFIFGGKGIDSAELDFITKTQSVPRVSIGLMGLIESVKNPDVFIVVFVFIISIAIYLFKKRTDKLLISIYFSVASILLLIVNFYIGNQSSRYVMLSSVLSLSLIPVLVNNRRLVMLLLICLSLVYTFKTPTLFGIWTARFLNIRYMITDNNEMYANGNVGCSNDAVSFLVTSKDRGNTLNLWDPHAAVYFFDKGVFVGYGGAVDRNFVNIKYVYINEQYKTEFLKSKDYHSDMNIEDRVVIESKLIDNGKIVFSKDKCLVYEIFD